MRHRRQVFADPSGRRRRIAARAGLACAAVLVGYLLLLVTGLTSAGRYGVPGWHEQARPTVAPTASPTAPGDAPASTGASPHRSAPAQRVTTSPTTAASPAPSVTASSPAAHGRPTAVPGKGHSKSPGR